MTLLVTGGAGFIGSAVIRHLLQSTDHRVVNLDKLTYAANLDSLDPVQRDPKYTFVQADITDRAAVDQVLLVHQPSAIMHLAAESHVDRSIDGPATFIHTNIVGSYTLLEAARDFWGRLPSGEKEAFRFHHISTDEVYGELHATDPPATERAAYEPSSPYSASKASSDHLVRAWHRTYGLPTIVTNCSNNYGPFQFPEKLIPHMILNAIHGKPLPVYGDGQQIRDWLYVEDHARALVRVIEHGHPGNTYNIGGRSEQRNLAVVEMICDLLEEMAAERKPKNVQRFRHLITFVKDRPGHDVRYSIDPSKIELELGWRTEMSFESGLAQTVRWYLENEEWWQRILSGAYKLERIGQ